MSGSRLFGAGLLLLTLASAAPAGPPSGPPECERSLYSRWHYWAPTLYRVCDAWRTPNIHPTSGGATSAVIVRYPCPSVPPAANYSNTGLSYDPARAVVIAPAAAR